MDACRARERFSSFEIAFAYDKASDVRWVFTRDVEKHGSLRPKNSMELRGSVYDDNLYLLALSHSKVASDQSAVLIIQIDSENLLLKLS